MTISTYVSLVFPAVCNVTLHNLNSSTGFKTTNLVVTVLKNSVLPPLRTYVVSRRALLNVPTMGLSFVLPFVYFMIVVVCKRHAYTHIGGVGTRQNWCRWRFGMSFNWVLDGYFLLLVLLDSYDRMSSTRRAFFSIPTSVTLVGVQW